MSDTAALGVVLEPGRARAALVDADGSVLATAAEADDPADALASVAQGCRPSAFGIAALPDDSRIAAVTAKAQAMSAAGGRSAVCTPGAALAVAEAWLGAARGARHVVAFAVGDVTTAGVLIDGRLWRGAHDLAGSVAWLALNPVEREDYRRLGSLEAEVAAQGIVRRLIWRVKSGDRSRVVEMAGGDLAVLTIDHVLAGARASDGVAISVIRDTVKYLAMAAANLAATVDPEVLVLGGMIETAGDLLFEPLRQEFARRVSPALARSVRLELARLGAVGPAIGAARLALGDA